MELAVAHIEQRGPATDAAAVGEAAKPPPRHPPLAIFTVHGMGEQVRFEEIDKIVRMLEAEGPSRWAHVGTTARIAAPNGNPLARAEVTFRNDAGEEREIHVYESYWASVTEGKVTLSDAVTFLLQAGWDGIKYAREKVFDRFEFGGNQRYPVSANLKGWFLFILCILGAVILLNTSLTILLAGSTILGYSGGHFGKEVVFAASAALALVLAVSLLMGLSFIADSGSARKMLAKPGAPDRPTAASKPFGRTRSSFLMVATLVVLVASALAVGVMLLWPHAVGDWIAARWSVPSSPVWSLGEWAILGISFVAAKKMRDWLVAYIGDLAAYLCAHKASKFDEIRTKVQQLSLGVLQDVYAAKGDGGPLYPKVIVIGHSLGSVIAYDTLNAVMRQQMMFPDKFPGAESVAARTHLFLTCGSPLDTTAFIFRSMTDAEAVVRDMLACSMQPLILDERFRSARWVNIWTNMDPISGDLAFYDPLADQSGARHVENVLDPYGIVPFVSHSDYFVHPPLRRIVSDSIAELWESQQSGSGESPPAPKEPSRL